MKRARILRQRVASAWAAATAAMGLMLALAATPAQALLTLTPATSGVIGQNLGIANCEPNCVYTAFGLVNNPGPADNLRLYYQSDAPPRTAGNGAGIDSGLFANSYDTTYANSFFNPQGGLISFTGAAGTSIVCPACYLAIKDGNQDPSYYFYDLSSWNGTESILLANFWPDEGSITHIAIWGRNAANDVPEPNSLLLGALALAAGWALRRRR